MIVHVPELEAVAELVRAKHARDTASKASTLYERSSIDDFAPSHPAPTGAADDIIDHEDSLDRLRSTWHDDEPLPGLSFDSAGFGRDPLLSESPGLLP